MGKIKILLLDDSEATLQHISQLLLEKGYEIATASSLEQASNCVQKFNADALLVDHVLGSGLNGLQAIQAILLEFERIWIGKKTPSCALLVRSVLPVKDAELARSQNITVLKKPVMGKDEDFLQEVVFWLKANKLLQ